MNDLLSIIIPVYNVSQYIGRCLDSIINQTYPHLEIICINDGSTDNSGEILEAYSKKDSRIKLINQTNGGMSLARNAGLKMAKGKYITFVDADDYINTEAYALCLPLFNLNIDVVMFSAKVVIEKGGIDWDDDYYFLVHQEGLVNITTNILQYENVSVWNKIYKTSIIHNNNINFPNGLWYEDLEFYWKYMSFVKNAYFMTNELYNYARRSGSIMFATFLNGSERSIDHLAVYDHLLSFWLSDSKFKSFIDELGAKLFEDYFYRAYLHAPYKMKTNIITESKKLVDKYDMIHLFPQSLFINHLMNNQLYRYKWIDEYTFVQKIFSVKKFRYEKIIHILGFRILLKRKIFYKIKSMMPKNMK